MLFFFSIDLKSFLMKILLLLLLLLLEPPTPQHRTPSLTWFILNMKQCWNEIFEWKTCWKVCLLKLITKSILLSNDLAFQIKHWAIDFWFEVLLKILRRITKYSEKISDRNFKVNISISYKTSMASSSIHTTSLL